MFKQNFEYNVDIVMCIDATSSMAPFIDKIKDDAHLFYGKYVKEMQKVDKSVQQLRVKVILFRDFRYDTKPLVESKFFTLPKENEKFCNFVDKIEACGGPEWQREKIAAYNAGLGTVISTFGISSDSPSVAKPIGNVDGDQNGLEALALAMKSDWVREGTVRRHIILLWTDSAPVLLGTGTFSSSYPSDMPADLAELHEWWEGQEMDSKAKRIIIFAPDVYPWSDMIDWQNLFHQESSSGGEMSLDTCIHMLVHSI